MLYLIIFTEEISPRHVRRWVGGGRGRGGLVPTQEKKRLKILGNWETLGKCLKPHRMIDQRIVPPKNENSGNTTKKPPINSN